MNSNLIEDEHRSSFFFQKALDFIDKDKISNIQFEYLYFCIQKSWYHNGEKLKEILKCFIKCSDQYFDKIVEKTREHTNSYIHICNCLNSFNDNEFSLQIANTGYTLISFFSKVLENEDIKLEDAKCIWENYKFQRLSVPEKQIQKQIFEAFWRDREDNCLYGSALEQLFELNENNIHEKMMSKAYNFITTISTRELPYFSPNLIVACHFCEEKKNKEILDEEYKLILDLIKYSESSWEEMHGKLYQSAIFLYKTLHRHTNKNKYYEKYKNYELLELEEKIENFEITSYFDFFCSLYEIFENDLEECNDISLMERQLLDDKNEKIFLESINFNNICAIDEGMISSKYLKLYQLKDIEFAGRKEMLIKCEELAINNNKNLIQLIRKIPKNDKYIKQINELLSELDKSVVLYDDEE